MILRHKVKSHRCQCRKKMQLLCKAVRNFSSTTAKERAVAETILLLAGQKQSMKKISPLV